MSKQTLLNESQVQMKIKSDSIVQNGILTALSLNDYESSKIHFIDEDEYINRITADFSLVIDNTIKAIIECKSGKINVTDYVRGIGQLYQYEYFCEKNIPHKSYEYDSEFATVYFYPSSVLKINDFNIAKFKYPHSMKILELNENNNAVRLITNKELDNIRSKDDNLITISQYYFRDNRMFEYYILLKHLLHKKNMGIENCDRKLEEEKLQKINSINNKNWRNAFITLSNLGLIDKNNIPTIAGSQMAILEYDSFAYCMYKSYIQPYFDEICSIFDTNKIKISNSQICEKIKNKYYGKDVLYLTQSNNRYISSWLNIMRDDYGIIDFQPKTMERKILYNPSELNETGFKNKIKQYSIAYNYIDYYQKLLRNGEL